MYALIACVAQWKQGLPAYNSLQSQFNLPPTSHFGQSRFRGTNNFKNIGHCYFSTLKLASPTLPFGWDDSRNYWSGHGRTNCTGSSRPAHASLWKVHSVHCHPM